MSLWGRKPYISLRVLGKAGQYPSFDLRSPAHIYSGGSDIVWSATLQGSIPEDWELSESPVLVPEEVRLLSAVALSERELWEQGLPIIAVGANEELDPTSIGCDFTDAGAYRRLEEHAIALAARLAEQGPYSRRADLGNAQDAKALLEAMNPGDQLLLAGLARLQGGTRLVCLAHEIEEASLSLFTSMTAALELLRLRLSSQAGRDVPFSAVYDYFRGTFDHGEEVAEYFEARYEERVIAVHPANRFGTFWTIPVMVGDVLHLHKTVIGLYRHILLGETKGW